MKKLFFLLLLLLFQTISDAQNEVVTMKHKIAIAVQGGAGNFSDTAYTDEQKKVYKNALSEALDSGYAILKKGGSSIDAVVAAVKMMEDNPLFNAGRGSVFTNDGKNEMDAAVMKGKNLKCGAVTCVRHIKNPVEAARKVMDSSQFVFLSAEGAEQFAKKEGLEIEDTSYFFTPFRWEQLQKIKNSDTTHLDSDTHGEVQPPDETKIEKFGTVGCVAIDANGNLAAATSTGGIANKKYNRIGDSPIIGAGTYANNKTCAVSCTGKGDDFIRLVVAHDISALMEYKRFSLKRAVQKVILEKLKAIGGRGGCIAIDRKSNIEMPFTTSGMFRGSIDKNGKKKVAIYKEP